MILYRTHNGLRPFGTEINEMRVNNCQPTTCKPVKRPFTKIIEYYKITFSCGKCEATSHKPVHIPTPIPNV